MAALFSIRSILSINAYSVVINFIFWFQNNHISSFLKPGKIFLQFVGFDLQTIGATLDREVVKLWFVIGGYIFQNAGTGL